MCSFVFAVSLSQSHSVAQRTPERTLGERKSAGGWWWRGVLYFVHYALGRGCVAAWIRRMEGRKSPPVKISTIGGQRKEKGVILMSRILTVRCSYYILINTSPKSIKLCIFYPLFNTCIETMRESECILAIMMSQKVYIKDMHYTVDRQCTWCSFTPDSTASCMHCWI